MSFLRSFLLLLRIRSLLTPCPLPERPTGRYPEPADFFFSTYLHLRRWAVSDSEPAAQPAVTRRCLTHVFGALPKNLRSLD